MPVPADTTGLLGGRDPADPRAQAWLEAVAAWLAPGEALDARPSAAHAGWRLWPLLGSGAPGFSAERLHLAVPAGDAWLAALRPDLFFAQAAERLEAAGGDQAERWAGRLRQPTGNLAIIGRLVQTFALSLDLGSPSALRLRVGCADTPSAVQASMLLHAWRGRRGAGADAIATAFADATVHRVGTRVEMTFPGTPDVVTRLIVPRR